MHLPDKAPTQKNICGTSDEYAKLSKQNITREWATKQDRVNSQLLENLRSSSDEVSLHRSILQKSIEEYGISERVEETIDDTQWARLVLKHWLLDDAAAGRQGRLSSTNGAVDSEGMVHDVKIELETEVKSPEKSIPQQDELDEGGK